MTDQQPQARDELDRLMAEALRRDPDRIVLRSEFAVVSVKAVGPAGRQRLSVVDLRTGQSIELDAIELESLAWARHSDLAPHLDPSATRWTNKHSDGTDHDD